jgi:hypothetical protein
MLFVLQGTSREEVESENGKKGRMEIAKNFNAEKSVSLMP